MIRRVVVGYDGSPAATAALAWATEEARLHEAELVACTVAEPPAPGDDPAMAAASPRGLADVPSSGYPVSVLERHGDAPTELVAACTEEDVLAVGSRGRGPLAGLVRGSVSQSCLAHAPCPVVVVRPQPAHAGSQRRVVVGVDGSGHSREALYLAAEEAQLRGADLDIVHVVHWENIGTELITPQPEQLLEWGRNLVETEVGATGVTGRHLVIHGHPDDVLVQHSADADLLVLGSRGHSRVAGLLLGSTTGHCARHAHCPVMVTRASDRRQPDGDRNEQPPDDAQGSASG